MLAGNTVRVQVPPFALLEKSDENSSDDPPSGGASPAGVDDGVDNAAASAATDASRAVSVRRRAVALLIAQSAELAREGFFVESTALMNAARELMNAVTSDATVISLEAARRRREP